MPSSAVHRLEALLATRRLDATLAHAWRTGPAAPRLSSGMTSLDAALGGGWRTGELSEIIGPRSSGRTGVLWTTLAHAASQGHLVALVDTLDRFDPVSAAAIGLDLRRLLWVRGPAIAAESARPTLIEEAVQRGLRAWDLIVRAGGFAVAALDLADVPPRCVRALPAATWMRVAHANEGRPTVCLLVGDAPMGRSARGASVHLAARSRWHGDSLQSRRLAGLDVRAEVKRA